MSQQLKKVEIKDGYIYADGVFIGTVHGSSEVWVDGETGVAGERRQFVARFKYMSPRTKANQFIKFVFARLTMPEYLAKLAVAGATPLGIADELGFDSLGRAKAAIEKRQAKRLGV